MAEEERTRRWQRFERTIVEDPLQLLRTAIKGVREGPHDPEARRRLRAFAAEQGLWEQLALLLHDEARAADGRADVAVAFYEELADVHENLDQPLEMIAAMEEVVRLDPDVPDHHDRLAWLYRRAGAWSKAASSFEHVAEHLHDQRGRAALRAAGQLYRENGRLDRAVDMYREIVERKPSDLEAWRALDEVLSELGRWREVAEVRAAMASRAESNVEKAVLFRAQARALEQAGEPQEAAELVARAAQHAPEDVSGLVDYATVLARKGRTHEATQLLAKRVEDAIAAGAAPEDIAALQMRRVTILEEAGDASAVAGILEELLVAMPEYVPALERMAARAAQDIDPRLHAAALLRYAAALPDGEDRSVTVIAAARRYRDAHDYAAAVRVFQDATELAPDDDELRGELEDARMALLVERAISEAAAGERGAADRRLRGILASLPHHLGANLALVDLLSASGKHDAAAEHLRETLAAAPDGMPGDKLAPLVHRFALVEAALGNTDDAHQLLHEAHHLDRKALPITLALGESCFSRKLWREASLHLGKLAEHPDAAQHAAAVARGLVHAAQAEVRALRPANASKHYAAAVQVDPECAPAWHALAEAMMERGDLPGAADCLEREAYATTEPRDRLRLFDALGDLVNDVLGDPARAERCWMQVASDAGTPLLDKLLGVLRKRGAGIERAEICERLAAATDDKRRAKDLSEEAAEAFAAGDDLARACATASRLIAAHPLDVDAIATASSVALAAGDDELAATWLERALGAWESAGDRGADDPRRAELWRRLGDAEARQGKHHAAVAAYKRAVELAPDSGGALAARRGLVDLATETGKPANTSRVALVEADQDPDDVIAWARELARSAEGPEDAGDARAAYELARTLGVTLAPTDEEFLIAHPQRVMASDEAYSAALAEAERRELVDDPDDGPLADIFEMLGEVAALLCPDARTALARASLSDARRLPPTSNAAPAAVYPQIAKALGGPVTLLYASDQRSHPDIAMLLSSPPVIVIGPRLAAFRARSQSEQADRAADGELRFRLGRVVELARPRRIFAAAARSEELALVIDGLWHAFGHHAAPFVEPAIASEAERLRSTLPVALRRRVSERLADTSRAALDHDAYVAACDRAADRAGLLACAHVELAIELAGGPIAARHLVRLAAAPGYLAARRKLRPRR